MTTTTTAQEIFDTVTNHLMTQGKPAKEGHTCLYRSPDGLKCAVGCLIEDSEYNSDMEGTSVAGLIQDNRLPERLKDHSQLLADLQLVHDDWHPNQWEDRLIRTAYRYGLQFNWKAPEGIAA